jgi:uncharacterized protein YcfJ
MKTLITLSFLAFATPVAAQNVTATITDHYTTKTVSTPVTSNQCVNVDVPVYGQAPANTGDAIMGAIIGGVIGNQFGEGQGKDAMTILGAIAGADAASSGSRNRIVGYRTERQCSEVVSYRDERVQQYSHSTATFVHNGKRYSVNFMK